MVNPKTAMGLIPFYSGVTQLAADVGATPLIVYRKQADGKRKRDDKSRAWQLLHDQPNEQMASDEWLSIVESHIDTWGNHFSWKEKAGDGRLANAWPLSPNRVRVSRATDGTILYTIDGQPTPYTQADILHIRGLSLDGLVGYSPVQIAKEQIGVQLARQKFAGHFWANDATPGVVLQHPNRLSEEAAKRLKASWNNSHRGPGNARGTAVIEEGMTVHSMTLPLNDAQFIEQEQLGRGDIALLLRIPPFRLLAETGSSLTYSTVEGQSTDYGKWSLRHRFTRIENSLGVDPDILRSDQYAEFLMDAVMRGTTKERYEGFAVAPHLKINEMRVMDNLEPIPEGDVLSESVGVKKDTTKQDGTSGA